jgi:hypothetical protein
MLYLSKHFTFKHKKTALAVQNDESEPKMCDNSLHKNQDSDDDYAKRLDR